MVKNLCLQAVRATFLTFPAACSRSSQALIRGLQRVATSLPRKPGTARITNACLPDLAETGSLAPNNCAGLGRPGRDDPRAAPVAAHHGSSGLSRPGTGRRRFSHVTYERYKAVRRRLQANVRCFSGCAATHVEGTGPAPGALCYAPQEPRVVVTVQSLVLRARM